MKMSFSLFLVLFTFTFYSCSSKLSPDHHWGDRKWVLFEIKGNPVQLSGTDRDAHIVFFAPDKRYSGSGGCNRLNGIYQLSGKDKLSFGETTTTKMHCPDQAFEDNFLIALKTVNSYKIEDGVMLLKKGKEVVAKLR